MLKIDDKTGLVLEGGGMRGVFTCGVLDYFMDAGLHFPYAIGVSAGACNQVICFCFYWQQHCMAQGQALFTRL